MTEQLARNHFREGVLKKKPRREMLSLKHYGLKILEDLRFFRIMKERIEFEIMLENTT